MTAFVESMPQGRKYAFLIGILILGTFLRFYQFAPTPPGLFTDEAMDGNDAAAVATSGQYQVFYPEDNGREGLYVNLVAILFRDFHAPHEAWVVRLPAAIAGVLTILGLYLLVAELFGDGAGLLAAFFLATSFWHINFSRIGFRAILAPLLLTWALYLLINTFQTRAPKLAWWYAGIAGVVYALGFYTYIAYRVTPLLLLLFIPAYRNFAGFWKRSAAFACTALLVAAPLGWYFLHHPRDFMGRVTQISVMDSRSPLREFAGNLGKTALMFNVAGDANWRHNISGAPELFWPVGILFLIGAVYGVYQMGRGVKGSASGDSAEIHSAEFGWVLTFLWMLLAALPAAIADEGVPHALRALLLAPPAMILAGAGGEWLYRLLREHGGAKPAAGLAAIFLAVVSVYGYVDYFVVWGHSRDVPRMFSMRWVTVGKQISALPASTPKYVIVEAGGPRVHGIPALAQTTMFVTNSYLPEQQAAENIHYVLPEQAASIPAGAAIFHIR